MTLTITNMTCNHCVRTITMALMKERIVATIDLANQTLTVDDKESKEKVVDVITKAGYNVE
jgi:copper chaperone CopZ